MAVAADASHASATVYALTIACSTIIFLSSFGWHFWLRLPRDQDDTGAIIAVQANLQYCSVDLFLEIVSYLDCEEVLRLRQVSKRMNAMSRLRAAWEPLAVKNASMLLKKRVDACTAQELEDAVVQHRKARTDVLSATRCIEQGTLFLGQYISSRLCLAPGGRWLLNDTKGFRFGVVYVDLDASQPTWRQLIPPGSRKARDTGMSLDEAYDGSNLSFNLALETVVEAPGESEPYRSNMERNISVWQVSPTFDSDGVIDGLTAEEKFFCRLPAPSDHTRTLELQGPYLLFLALSIVSVIRWKDVELGSEDFLQKTVSYPDCDYAHLLTERWLLVGSSYDHEVAILDLSLVVSTTASSSPAPATTPYRWALWVENVDPPFPPPRIVGNTVYQHIPMLQGICLLELDLSSDTRPPRMTHLDGERCHCCPDTRSYSRDIFAYFDDVRKEPFLFVFDTRHRAMIYASPQVFPIAVPFLLSRETVYVFLDAYSPRLVLRGSGGLCYICSFSTRPMVDME